VLNDLPGVCIECSAGNINITYHTVTVLLLRMIMQQKITVQCKKNFGKLTDVLHSCIWCVLFNSYSLCCSVKGAELR
jgi:hypothetical protein